MFMLLMALTTCVFCIGQVIDGEDRERIARLRNCILALSASKLMLFDSSIQYAYEESSNFSVST